jgi:hypothetical protein
MNSTVIALALLAAYLPATAIVHIVLARLGRRELGAPAQGTAVRAAALTTIAWLACTLTWMWGRSDLGPVAAYVGLGSGALGYMYFLMFCNTESGRRYRMLKLLMERGALGADEIRASYSAKHMIAVRLERLLKWRVLEQANNQLVIRKRTSLWISVVFRWWSQLLGFHWAQRQASVTAKLVSIPRSTDAKIGGRP